MVTASLMPVVDGRPRFMDDPFGGCGWSWGCAYRVVFCQRWRDSANVPGNFHRLCKIQYYLYL